MKKYKKYKYIFPAFTFYDRTGIRDYLEKKAAEGWMLERLGGFSWKFHRIEPKKIHFAVTYFPKASAFDPGPSEQQLRLQEFCAHSGWQMVACSAQLQIFSNEQENPVPIETDPQIELENIHNTAVKNYLPCYFLMIPVMIMPILNVGYMWKNDPLGLLSTNIYLFNIFTAVICGLLSGRELIGYFMWYRRAKKAAEDGKFLETRGSRNFQLILAGLMMICLVIYVLYAASIRIAMMMVTLLILISGSVALSVGATKLMKRMNFSAKKNHAITMTIIVVSSLVACGLGTFGIVSAMDRWDRQDQDLPAYEFRGSTHVLYRDEIPLKIEHLMDVDPEIYSYRISWSEKSLLLNRLEVSQQPRYDMLDQPDLRYSIIEVKADWLYDFVLEKLLETDTDYWSEDIYGNITYDEYRQVDASEWGAEQAYQLYNGENVISEFLLCYDGCIVELNPDWDITQDQMGLVGQFFWKLNKNSRI